YYESFLSSRRRHTRSKRDWSSDVCSSDLQPCADTRSQTGTVWVASTSNRRTPYGAPDAPVIASTTGSCAITVRDDWAWGSAAGAREDGAARENAERGSRKAEPNDQFDPRDLAQLFRVPRFAFCVSYQSIDQRPD